MRDFRDAKVMAHSLREALRNKAVETTHSEALELIAKVFGFDNWNILSAKIEAAAPRTSVGAPAQAAPKTLYCSFCSKSQHDVAKLIAGPGVYICDECAGLCMDILREEAPIWRVVSLLFGADEKGANEACLAALEHVRGTSAEELAAYVEAAKSFTETHRQTVLRISRALAVRDGDVPAEGDVLASPDFAHLRERTKAELMAMRLDTQRTLKRYEDALRIGTTVLSERGRESGAQN